MGRYELARRRALRVPHHGPALDAPFDERAKWRRPGAICPPQRLLVTPFEETLAALPLRCLILYEPPIFVPPHRPSGLADRLQAWADAGDLEGLMVTFMREGPRVPEAEIAALRAGTVAFVPKGPAARRGAGREASPTPPSTAGRGCCGSAAREPGPATWNGTEARWAGSPRRGGGGSRIGGLNPRLRGEKSFRGEVHSRRSGEQPVVLQPRPGEA